MTSKKIIYITAAFLALFLSAFSLAVAQPDTQETQKAPSAFVPEPVYEFTTVLEGDNVVHDFTVMNKGDATLEIQKVRTG